MSKFSVFIFQFEPRQHLRKYIFLFEKDVLDCNMIFLSNLSKLQPFIIYFPSQFSVKNRCNPIFHFLFVPKKVQ